MASLVKRGKIFYAQFYLAGRLKRRSLDTDSWQIAKDRLRQFESARARGDHDGLPTRTPAPEVVGRYVDHIRSIKTPKSAQTDVYYLREIFGPLCPALQVTSRRLTGSMKKRPPLDGRHVDRRRKAPTIEATYFEHITAAQVSARGLAPRTANRYREILCRLFNWAMKQGGIRMPNNANPIADVERYKEHAPQIRFLTLDDIDRQLAALADYPQLQVMAALYIYSGLRREEALWLTIDDVDLGAATNGMIRVRAKTLAGESWQPKTKANRAVPVSSALRAWLVPYAPRPSEGPWFFPSPEGRRWDVDNFSHHLREANRKAGLPWACLDYRHTFGSQLAMKGESLYKIATLMGNSPEICRRHYAALIPEDLADSVEFNTKVVSPHLSIARAS